MKLINIFFVTLIFIILIFTIPLLFIQDIPQNNQPQNIQTKMTKFEIEETPDKIFPLSQDKDTKYYTKRLYEHFDKVDRARE